MGCLGLTGLHYFGARYLDSRLSVWFGVDPLAGKYPDHSSYNYVLNNPVKLIDPTGLTPEDGGGDPIYTANGPDVTISAKRIGSNHNQAPERYGYSGDWKSYQKEFNLQGWDYNSYDSYYNHVKRDNFDASVIKQDKKEAARIALEKLAFFTAHFKAVEDVAFVLPGGNGASLLRYRAMFRFTSPVAAKGGTRAFWSGAGSEAKALEQGFGTLGQTRAGQNFIKLTEGMSYYPAMNGQPASQAYQWWARLSTQYAKGASGTINVFQNAQQGVGMQSIWRLYEYPTLLKNPDVTGIKFHY